MHYSPVAAITEISWWDLKGQICSIRASTRVSVHACINRGSREQYLAKQEGYSLSDDEFVE